MKIFSSLLNHSQTRTSHSLYPTFKLEHNFLFNSASQLVVYFISLFSLPVKLLLRKNFGYRYFGLLEYALYLFFAATVSFWFILGTAVLIIGFLKILFSDLLSELEYLIHLPFLSLIFILWLSIKIYKAMKLEIAKPLDKIPKHGYYPGDSIFSYSNEELNSDSEYIRNKLEPSICILLGLLLLPIDIFLGIYFLLISLSLRIENWYQKRERTNAVIDLTDSIIDSIYQDEMLKKFQECEHNKIPINRIYHEMVNTNFNDLKNKVDNKLKLNLPNLENEKEVHIDNLLNRIK